MSPRAPRGRRCGAGLALPLAAKRPARSPFQPPAGARLRAALAATVARKGRAGPERAYVRRRAVSCSVGYGEAGEGLPSPRSSCYVVKYRSRSSVVRVEPVC